jgi:peptide/nickel transport system substrate-binding protein
MAVQSLLNGECDVLVPGVVNESAAAQALGLQDQGLARLFIQPAAAWEQITLGISRVDGIPSPFASPQVRQAAALCMDRQALAGQVLDGLAQPAPGMLVPGHPAALPTGAGYDPAQAQELLQAAGWLDDGDPATPRTASGAAGFADGTPLRVVYLTAPDADRQAAANFAAAALAECGFQVEVVTQPFDAYLAAGPDGPVFGRTFDLAQFAWPAAGVESLCGLYLSSEIPGPYPQYPRGWGGGNAGGFSSPAFDQSCQALRSSPPDSPLFTQAVEQVQAVFQAEVPAIPLYWRYRLALARSDLCGVQVDASTGAFTWNIEQWRFDQSCAGD